MSEEYNDNDNDNDRGEGEGRRVDTPGRRWWDIMRRLEIRHEALEKRVDQVSIDVRHLGDWIKDNHTEAMRAITGLKNNDAEIVTWLKRHSTMSNGMALLVFTMFAILLMILAVVSLR